MNRYLIILSLTLLLGSCSERVELSVENTDKLLVECVLVPDQEITAILSTVAHFSQIDNVIYPQDARVYLTTSLDVPLEFQFDPDRQLYFIPKGFHTPNPANPYEITAFLKNSSENQVNSKTKFISATQFVQSRPSEVSLNDNGLIQVKTNLKTNKRLSSKESYFIVNAFYKPIIDGIPGDLKPLRFTGNSEDPLAFFTNEFTEGVLVNLSRVDFTDFEMSFEFPSDVNSLDDVEENIYLVVSTINEELYRYDLSKSKRLSSLKYGSSDPVMSYSNMENGFGVFGTKNNSVNQIQIK